MKLHSLRQTKADRNAAETAREERMEEMREPEGIEVHISHDHMQKMGMGQPPRSGTEVELHGRGHVVASHTEDVNGEPRHHMRIRLTHAGVDADDGDEPRGKGIRAELTAAESKVRDGGKVKLAALRNAVRG